ncbi:hypothetical protein [Alsobacter sp. SYSU BS001988]
MIGGADCAWAECRVFTRNQRFFPAQNDSVTWRSMIGADSKRCSYTFTSAGKLIFTSSKIATQPSSGVLTQTGAFKLAYARKGAGTGRDKFAVSVCGTGPQGSGCSTVNYDVVLE